MAPFRLNGRLRRLEGAYADVLRTPEELDAALWKQRTVIICHQPQESHEEALARTGVDPDAWGKVEFKRWLWEHPSMPEHPLWLHGTSSEESQRYEAALIAVHAQRDAERQARREHHGQEKG
jgi:hypothetical protein